MLPIPIRGKRITIAGEHILIVEDEAITGMDISEMVCAFGYEPHGPVVTGKAAVESALALWPDVILTDTILKGPMTGIQAAEAIRVHYHCPVIYLTGSSDQISLDLVQLTEPLGLVLNPSTKKTFVEPSRRRSILMSPHLDTLRMVCRQRYRKEQQHTRQKTNPPLGNTAPGEVTRHYQH